MTQTRKIEVIGAKTSLSLGLICGIAAMVGFAIVSVILTGESFFLLSWFFVNGYATLGLLVSFVIVLWLAGKMLAIDILKNKPEFLTKFKYSGLVNFVIWSVFLLVHFITNKSFDFYFGFTLPLILAGISIIFTPFTVGLLIYKRVALNIKRI